MPTFIGQVNTPPAAFREVEGPLYAHCPDSRCQGNEQEVVDAVVTIVEESCLSRGGGGTGAQIIENTREHTRFKNLEDADCRYCGRLRELSAQERPVYQNLSFHDPYGLLKAPKFDPNVRNTPADEAMAAEAAELRRQIAEMREQMGEFMEANKRRPPGRPPKAA